MAVPPNSLKPIEFLAILKWVTSPSPVEDLSIPMMGMPISILRTYDTRRKGEALDFGHGWSVNYQSIKIEESRVPGKYWALNKYGSFISGRLCLEPLGSTQVTVTLPDGQVETFEVQVQPSCGPIFQQGPVNPAVSFKPHDGTFSKLEPLDALSSDIDFDSRDLIDLSTCEAFNPSRYRLTTQAGYEYELDEKFGIKSIKDPNGNTLTYTKEASFTPPAKAFNFNVILKVELLNSSSPAATSSNTNMIMQVI
jgi:hypothetical protein